MCQITHGREYVRLDRLFDEGGGRGGGLVMEQILKYGRTHGFRGLNLCVLFLALIEGWIMLVFVILWWREKLSGMMQKLRELCYPLEVIVF